MQTIERRNVWKEFLLKNKKLFMSFDEKWEIKFDEVKEFIRIYKNLPTQHSKNSDEKPIGSWISTQQKNYKNKKKSMQTVERQNIWKEFLLENREICKLQIKNLGLEIKK